MVRPKKRLGQNFLINQAAARRIARLVSDSDPANILEIGGGRGDLTAELVKIGRRLTVVEFDSDLIAELQTRFGAVEHFNLVESDILKVEPLELLSPAEATLVGNIPYNITSPILEWMIEHRAAFPRALLMMQREVADRVCAVPGSKQFGSLTVFVQLFYDCSREFTLKPGSFFPPPSVSSAVVMLTRKAEPLIADAEYPSLRRLTSACFRWRRKQLGSILRREYSLGVDELTACFEQMRLDPESRPEQLRPEDIVRLSRILGEIPKDGDA